MNQTIDNNLKAISNRRSQVQALETASGRNASQLVRENDVDLGIVLTSPTDKVYAFVHPTSNAVIDRFINLKTDFGDRFVAENLRDKVNQLNDRLNEFDKREESAKESLLALNEMDKTREKSLGVHRSVSILGALRASSDMTMLEQCRVLHELASVIGLVVVGSGLIDEYGKCGVVGNSRRVFDELEMEIDVVGWNTMMVGSTNDSAYVILANTYASATRRDEVRKAWKRMKDKKVRKYGGKIELD
ncbi:hypothetical protein T459_11110 [Capsicum annuum]|uniref:MADS-box domain-containing protein n=1 Tax=Capsicum annuum TaxID=4072 RepID=A0A2G2ZKZ6_CAPAN|nr:hypothetical protein T459_11110 [Capsicum annuum]